MMNIQLAVAPSGRIVAVESSQEAGELADVSPDAGSDQRLEKRIAQQFASSQAEGLFALATERMDRAPNPSFAYWRDFASRYLTELCHTPEITGAVIEAIPPPASAELDALLLNVPPLQGAEYLSEGVLSEIWTDLDAWVRARWPDTAMAWPASSKSAPPCGIKWAEFAFTWPRTAAIRTTPSPSWRPTHLG